MTMQDQNQCQQVTEQAAQAAQWRELMTLLQRKAYGRMSPADIAENFPDLREIYRTTLRQTARPQRM